MTQEAKIITGIGLVTLAIIIGGVLIVGKTDQKKEVSTAVDTTILTRNANHTVSTPNAKVTIVEFADFQCPACANAHPQIKQLLATYKGNITYIYRHFPLPQHNNAIPAAKAAEAAGEQGKFWEMHDILYQRQTEWSESNNPLELFTTYAKELGLNLDRFTKDATSSKYDEAIQKDKNDALALGVNATPTIFINNKRVEITATFENLKKITDTELKD